MKRIVVTGAGGLLGWHAHAHLHAANCAADFQGMPRPWDIVALDRTAFNDDSVLEAAVTGAECILHFAGVNRASETDIERGNPDIAQRLVAACQSAGADPHVVYANSIHSRLNTVYGNSKRRAGDILAHGFARYSDMILPHIFGEGARPYYNNVTATLIDQLLTQADVTINPDGQLTLVHAGAAAAQSITAISENMQGELVPEGISISVPDLFEKLAEFHDLYGRGIYPDLSDPFDVALFNSYRAATYPTGWPRSMTVHTDARGRLFEAIKGGGGGQVFCSTTQPGVTRGDHFHLHKVERFLVIQGEAIIRIRPVLKEDVWEFRVSGLAPSAVDMPTLHTHSIQNIGDTPLVTLFWTNGLFDPQNPDTYADKVCHA